MHLRCSVLLALGLLLGGMPLAAQSCSEVTTLAPRDLASWVEVNRETADRNCLTEAIRRLGETKNPASVPVLIELLGFERPDTEAEKLHVSSTRDRYPAVPALASIGKPAVQAIIDGIRTKDLDPISRKNALRALILANRSNPPDAIAALRDSIPKAKLGIESERLQAAIGDAVLTCPKSWHDRCAAATSKP